MRAFIFISIVALFTSCSRQEANTSSETPATNPETTILNFLSWYKKNGAGLAEHLVLNNGAAWDSTKFYAVNFQATENYLKTFAQTGMISEAYVSKRRAYFKKCDTDFKNNPINEGPPQGFDYDLVLFSQEDPGLDELDKATFEVLKKTERSAQLLLKFPSGYAYTYSLSKDGESWKIDDIEPTH